MVATLTESSPSAASTTNAGQLIDVHKLSPENAVQRLIEHAVSIRASDLFLVTNEQHVAVQVRHLGVIRTISMLPPDLGKRCMAHISASAGIDVSDRRNPPTAAGSTSAAPTKRHRHRRPAHQRHPHHVRRRLRHPPARRATRACSTLEQLGMTPQAARADTTDDRQPRGLILIAGPTGSGKTATLYASLHQAQRRQAQDQHDRRPRRIHDRRPAAIPGESRDRSRLRRAAPQRAAADRPDVIMVGEIRDAETAQTAVHAANSGMLVFATIHAPPPPGPCSRCEPSACTRTSSPPPCAAWSRSGWCAPSARSAAKLRPLRCPAHVRRRSPVARRREGKTLFAPRGCDACNNAGYAGRTGVFEVMPTAKPSAP